jgi:diguanylate cyclase (GGDEF)-like protein/PAS domain S-box-containing protein
MTKSGRKNSLLWILLPAAAVIVFQASMTWFSLAVSSSVRAYVGGEGHWSKGQKDAIQYIKLYAMTGKEEFFQKFRLAIAIPLADRDARLALEQVLPDHEAARDGFLRGSNHIDDIPNMIRLFVYFRDLPYMATSVAYWRETDATLDALVYMAEWIRQDYRTMPDSAGVNASKIEWIEQVEGWLAPRATAFSESLSDGSRQISFLLTLGNLCTAALLIFLIGFHTRRMLRQRMQFEGALQTEKERAQITLSSIGEAVVSADGSGRVDFMNKVAENLTGYELASAHGQPLASIVKLLDPETRTDNSGLLEQSLSQPVSENKQLLLRRDGRVTNVSIAGSPLKAEDGASGAVFVLHDRTSEEEFVSQLSWHASHDVLTGLANRREFEARLEKTLGKQMHQGQELTLMFLDLDQFKIVNDTCGHGAGDELLKQTASALQESLRGNDLVARLGGDEFGILLYSENEDSLQVAERLRCAVQDLRFVWKGRAFNITASIGLVQFAQLNTVEEALQAADVACYMAKEKGRNRVQIYQPSDTELVQRLGEMAWVQRIRNALDDERLVLYAQEIRPLRTEKSKLSVEMLVRMVGEDGTLVLPGSFMPAAERYGLMPLIDRWVTRNAISALASHLSSGAAPRISHCAINLSGATFADENFIEYATQLFREFNVPPKMVCFEVTETSAISNLTSAKRLIEGLKAIGCEFALDDFGAGMSSFGYLKQLPVDYIKIDGSFVRGMLGDPVDYAMVEMIAHIAKVSGKRSIAECVESEWDIAALERLGVDFAQGYAIGKPEPFGKYLRASAKASRAVA